MSTSPSIRLPISIPEGDATASVREALLTHDNGLVVLNQAIKALSAQVKAGTGSSTAASSSTTTVVQNSETIVVGTSSNIGTVNNQSGLTAYSTAQSDNGAFVILSDALAIAVTLTTPLTIPWFCFFVNLGAGLATATPLSGTINGGAALSFTKWAIVSFDGTNFFGFGV